MDVPDEPAVVMVTDATGWQTSPVEGLAVNATTPVKVPMEVTVTMDEPEFVARILDGVTGPRATLKEDCVTLTTTLVVLDNVVGAVPVMPVIVRVKLAGDGIAVQLTVSVVPETLAMHPVGAALVENVTVPLKPLIAVNDSAEV